MDEDCVWKIALESQAVCGGWFGGDGTLVG
jgi:hypothetical protein